MSIRHLAFVIAISAFALPAAHAAEPGDATPAQPAAAATPMGCAKIARHDHGAERGTPAPMMSAGCPMAAEAAAGKTSTRAKPKKAGHDHARVHKLM